MITVIMNTYKEKEEYLQKAVNGILSQQNTQIQLILSTVENDPSIKLYDNNPNIQLCISKQPGIYAQLNNAIPQIKGNWFCYSSSNDFFLPTKLYNEKQLCLKHNAIVCYSAFVCTNEILKPIKTAYFYDYNYKTHLQKNFVLDCSLAKTNILLEYMPFKIKYGNFAYWDLWLNIAEKYGNKAFIYNNKPEWYYRITSNSRHIKKKKNAKLLLQEQKEKQSMLKSHLE